MGEKTQKNPLPYCKKEEQNFHCENCNYSTIRSDHYKKHLKTEKHINATFVGKRVKNVQILPKKPIKKVVKSSKKKVFYECKNCNYSTTNHANYIKHLETKKHKVGEFATKNLQENPKSCKESGTEKQEKNRYVCSHCEFSTENKKDFDRHENTNKHKKNVEHCILLEKQNNELITNMVVEIMKQNTDMFKTIITDQTQKIMEIQNNNAINNQCITNTNNNSNNNISNNISNSNNNNRFNINFFLNEKCKDAINMSEFIEALQVSFNDLEYLGSHGYVEGVSKIVTDKLIELGT